MKRTKTELDVDYIGGLGSLTKEEQMAISEFIKASKERKKRQKATQKTSIANKRLTKTIAMR